MVRSATSMANYSLSLIVVASVVLVGCSTTRIGLDDPPESGSEGMPFGKLTEADADNLMRFAKGKGFDLNGEFQKAYAKDSEALARVFRFSMAFRRLDQNARGYGQAIYSSFLNLGEANG